MTVHRNTENNFAEAPELVANAVRAVLARRPPYIKSCETERDTVFSTNIRPSWWLLGTEMTIQLRPSLNGTNVVAVTKSQWFLMGDAFNYYNRYIRNFFEDLRRELMKQEA